ncbi:hypothetical protein F5882DRAFT_517188 [Hyaloscypha sp. PMI_1271]|nr:hypothetical protein F5882DRAFT_517188 [Hyaloscypha sp. PMI_1271]
MAFQIGTGLRRYMQTAFNQSLPDLSDEDKALAHQFNEIGLFLFTELIKRETLASHIVKAETATPLTQGIPLDVIGWFSSQFSGGYMGGCGGSVFGAADATNFAKSKELVIKWLEEDMNISTYFARTVANLPNFIEGFYQTFLTALKEDRPLADIQIGIKDKAVEELVPSVTHNTGLTLEHDSERTREACIGIRGLLWKSPRPSKRQRRPLIWENAFGEVYLEIYQEKGIPFAKVSENGPAVINPEAARRTAVKQCDEYIKRVSSCQKVRYRGGVYQSPLQRREGSLGYSGSSSSNRRRPQRYVPGK